MEITKEKGKLVIRVPLKTLRIRKINNWFVRGISGGDGEMDNVVASYHNDNYNGFAYRIDMSYKGKPDQSTDYFLRLDIPKKELEMLAKKLNIETFYYYENSNSHKSTQEVRESTSRV